MSYTKFYGKPLEREDARILCGFKEVSPYNEAYLDAFIDGYEQCKKQFKATISLNNITGRNGISKIKLSDLNNKFTPDILANFGHQKDRFIVAIPIKTIYDINKICIVNEMSREYFLRDSVRKFGIKNKTYKLQQGGLF